MLARILLYSIMKILEILEISEKKQKIDNH